jgi:hypothetical protein
VAHGLALLSARLGHLDEADTYFADAVAVNERSSEAFHAARTHLAWGQMLLTRRRVGDVERGLELVDRALASARERGFAGVERAAIELLASPSAPLNP